MHLWWQDENAQSWTGKMANLVSYGIKWDIYSDCILMMNPLPTIAQAFSILAQEEKQREVKPHGKFNLESTLLHVNATSTNTSMNFRTNYTPYKNSGGSRPPYKFNFLCEYCKKPMHMKDKCYRLHGFSQNCKFTKGKNTENNSCCSWSF